MEVYSKVQNTRMTIIGRGFLPITMHSHYNLLLHPYLPIVEGCQGGTPLTTTVLRVYLILLIPLEAEGGLTSWGDPTTYKGVGRELDGLVQLTC